jgi:Tfp pilus assembly protein PilX
MYKQNKLFHSTVNNNHTGHCEVSALCGRRSNLPALKDCPAKLSCVPVTRNDSNAGYVLIITLLSLVALTVAGMGAMMVATTDVSLSGNQRTQVAAQVASLAGINTGMANLCSHSFWVAANPNYVANSINGTVINTPTSSPQASFYNGIYSTPVPATNAGSGYAVGYFTPTVNSSSAISELSSTSGPAGVSGSRASTLPTSFGFGGSVYTIGPVIGTAGTASMECEQVVYYGAPK